MSSILTNNGAMVALQTLRGINSNMAKTQSEISTGKSVANAKDNSAVWAISKTMESDVKGFQAIGDSLSLGKSTVAVARSAAETVTDLLTKMKGKIVAAQEGNMDRNTLNDDVTALREQINSVVGAAQFNGLNLVNGSTGSTDILASLDRDSAGNVTASSITIAGQDLSTGAYVTKAVFNGTTGTSTGNDRFASTIANGASGATALVTNEAGGAFVAGDKIVMSIDDQSVSYTVTAADAAATTTGDIVATAMKAKIEDLGITGLTVDYNSGTAGTLAISNATGNDISIAGQFINAGSGGLGALAAIDVSTGPGATAALASIEDLISTSIGAAAAFGSVQGRIETQASFISNMTDSLKSGIGAMVDADMEETSAKLQALQVQQQLGVQSLSIANQAPQSIMSLFR